MSENVLEVKNLCKYFDVNRGMKGAQKVIAVDGISFEVKKGKPSDWSENPAVEKVHLAARFYGSMSRQRAKSFSREKIFPGFPGKDASLPAEAADDLPGSICILKSPFYRR